MVMKRPSHGRGPPFAARFADVMEQSSPPQPQVIGMLGDIIDDLKRMIKIILFQ